MSICFGSLLLLSGFLFLSQKHYRVSQRGYPRFVPLEPYKQVSLHTAQPIPLGLSCVRYFFPILAGLYLLAFGPLSGGFCFPGFQ